jgi:putative ABC transport system substrate-binding protein
MRRREFIALMGGATAWPLAAHAQQPERIRRIAVLMGLIQNSREGQQQIGALVNGLRELGWINGRNAHIEYRWLAGESDQARVLAKELVALGPDVLVGHGTPVGIALLQETRTIPIVFVNVADPVGSGLVSNFAHPGGNATGLMNLEPSMGGKWVEVLKDLVPNIRRVTLMFNPNTAPLGGRYYWPSFEAAAASLAAEPVAAAVRDSLEIERTINRLAGDTNGGLIISPDLFLASNRGLIIKLAARDRVPAIYPFRTFTEAGGLISYGSDSVDIFRRAAWYVDRILKGANPADLPVQAPTKFELVINLKTAKALGLTVSREFLLRADEVIE